MELIKSKWTSEDKKEFSDYLMSIANLDKVDFAKKIINTNKIIIGIPTPELKTIAKEIAKGDFMGFLDLQMHDYYENEIINGLLICKIKDLDIRLKRLTDYAKSADCWAEIDLIKMKDAKKHAEIVLNYASDCTKSEYTFVRRLGVIILFEFVTPEYFDTIVSIVAPLKNEKEYYVNMAVAWLMCETVIKVPEQALDYVSAEFLNEFTLRKTISKCSDSYRVSDETVDTLRKRIKKQ